MSLISIVVPVYNEAGNVEELIGRIVASMNRIAPLHHDTYEIVVVNDGSQDDTLAALRALRETQPRLAIVDLSRNFGHQIAATAGLDAARGDVIVLMDGDLQDPPELIELFLEKWREGYDVVYATRKSRSGENAFKVLTARLFYRTIRRLTNVSIPVDTGDFRLMSRRVVDALGRTREKHRFLRGLVSWVGYAQIGVEYERDARHSGATKYPVSKMFEFALDGITSFSEIPLRFATYLGFTVSIFAFVYIVVVLVNKALGANEPGYTSIMVALLFLGGVILISLGIIGEYLGRIYDQVKERPLYFVSSVERDASLPAAAPPLATPAETASISP
ncbi:MAG: glycosyltransferase family 2 protein [Candidatus Eremiobacteraeota bacterium]|nr:glycosyltransferase family 2 protein [Candidatus Eremiobacteraeota bacterium]